MKRQKATGEVAAAWKALVERLIQSLNAFRSFELANPELLAWRLPT